MQTNRDKINAMTNEELAEFLTGDCPCDCKCCEETDCKGKVVKWLESEVEE